MRRTPAMKAFVASYAIVLLVLVVFVLNVLRLLPVLEVPDDGNPGVFALLLVVFGVLMLAVVVAAVWWTSAPRRPWFWLLGAIPGVAFFLPDIPMIVAALTSPASVLEFVLSLVIIAGVVVLVVSAVVASRDARRAISLATP